jgi:hypothetical protein
LKNDLLELPECSSGSSCTADGRCVTPSGEPADYADIPTTSLHIASGASFMDVDRIDHIDDRFRQALIDMASARRTLRLGSWASATAGIELETDRVFYAGQSLGGIIGAVFVALSDDVDGAVLNVPGAAVVDLFKDSEAFSGQMKALLDRRGLTVDSWEYARLLRDLRWIADTIDPQSVASALGRHRVMIQMDRDDSAIPNYVTERLQRASGVPMKTYPSSLHFDLSIPGIGDGVVDDLADFLAAQLVN